MTRRTPKSDSPAPPVLRVTRYDEVSSWLMAIIAALVTIVALLSIAWFASRAPPKIIAVPVELVEFPGGVEGGSVDETLRVDSPDPETPDARPGDVIGEEPELQASLESVLEAADGAAAAAVAAEPSEQQLESGTANVGRPGSSKGTGHRPALGSGIGVRGFPREQRWLVRFGDIQSVDEYARQLDFFGIEFGVVAGGKLVYVSKLSAARPVVRTTTSGAEERRLYMTWQGGNRKQADLQLFRKGGVEVGTGTIFHFYPKETEDKLAVLELSYRNRRADEIRRTYFSVKRAGAGYDFEVVRQTYLK